MEYTRSYVKSCPDVLFIFTDNTDRTSGHGLIDNNSWYSKKYGNNLCYPSVTAAQVRGLNNCYPISTQRWYHTGAKGIHGRWYDNDIDIFKSVIDDEVNDILQAINSGKYKEVKFCSEIVNGRISQITIDRTPKLYNYLVDKINLIKQTKCKCQQATLFD